MTLNCHQAVVSVKISKIHIWKKVLHEKWPQVFEKWSFGTLFSILSFLHRVGQLLFYGLMGRNSDVKKGPITLERSFEATERNVREQ